VTISFSGSATKPVQAIEIAALTGFGSQALGIVTYPAGTTAITYSESWTVSTYNGLGFEVTVKFEDQTVETYTYPIFTPVP
jgi:hypothetical protein